MGEISQGRPHKYDSMEELLKDPERERTLIGTILYEGLYNRIYDPTNELSDAEENLFEQAASQVERMGIENVSKKLARFCRRYRRYEINKFRLRWFAGSVNWIAVVLDRFSQHAKDKVEAYHKGYLTPVIELAKLKRLLNSIDIRIADLLLELSLDELFPTLRGLEGDVRRSELERLVGANPNTAISGYIDNPGNQRTYAGYFSAATPYRDREKINKFIDIIEITSNGLYFPPNLTEKLLAFSKILRMRVNGDDGEIDMFDAKAAQIFAECTQEEVEIAIRENKRIKRKYGTRSEKGRTATLQIRMLEALSGRIQEVFD